MPPLTFHLVPRSEWEAADPARPYAPAAFQRDGFVHCTDGELEVAATANRYFASLEGDLLALVLDRSALRAPVCYEDPMHIYPHVYGAIERVAIVEVKVLQRGPNGLFLPPT